MTSEPTTPDTLFTGLRLLGDGVDLVGDLLVRDGRILDFAPALGRPDGVTVVAQDGGVLCPGLIDLRAAYALGPKIEVYGRVENLFDQTYQTVLTYGSPGRTAYAGVRARL